MVVHHVILSRTQPHAEIVLIRQRGYFETNPHLGLIRCQHQQVQLVLLHLQIIIIRIPLINRNNRHRVRSNQSYLLVQIPPHPLHQDRELFLHYLLLVDADEAVGFVGGRLVGGLVAVGDVHGEHGGGGEEVEVDGGDGEDSVVEGDGSVFFEVDFDGSGVSKLDVFGGGVLDTDLEGRGVKGLEGDVKS